MPKIFTGLNELANQINTWLYGIIPATTMLVFAYHAWMKQLSEDEPGELARRNKAMKRSIIYGVLALSANGIWTFFRAALVG